MPVDIYILLMLGGHLTIEKQNENAFEFWNEALDLEHHPDSASGLIDFSDSAEKQVSLLPEAKEPNVPIDIEYHWAPPHFQ